MVFFKRDLQMNQHPKIEYSTNKVTNAYPETNL